MNMRKRNGAGSTDNSRAKITEALLTAAEDLGIEVTAPYIIEAAEEKCVLAGNEREKSKSDKLMEIDQNVVTRYSRWQIPTVYDFKHRHDIQLLQTETAAFEVCRQFLAIRRLRAGA
jgi:hypothetical protein